MNARILTTATIFTAFAGVLAARAADATLVGLVMPDAKMIAGVNVDQAKGSPFGLWVLTQLESHGSGLQDLIAQIGFDPTRDVHELLAASAGDPGSKSATGLALATGNFDPATIQTLALGKGALTETYGNVTIIEDPKKTAGIAFLNASTVMAGDLASVKAAIDRQGNGKTLPSSIVVQINQWSAAEDAWMVTTVPPLSLIPTGVVPGSAAGLAQQIQQFAGGVKFGNSVVGTAAILSDNATDATQLANTLQFLLNMAQMQAQNNADLTAVAKAMTIGAQGSTVKLTLTLPAAQFQHFIEQHKTAAKQAIKQ